MVLCMAGTFSGTNFYARRRRRCLLTPLHRDFPCAILQDLLPWAPSQGLFPHTLSRGNFPCAPSRVLFPCALPQGPFPFAFTGALSVHSFTGTFNLRSFTGGFFRALFHGVFSLRSFAGAFYVHSFAGAFSVRPFVGAFSVRSFAVVLRALFRRGFLMLTSTGWVLSTWEETRQNVFSSFMVKKVCILFCSNPFLRSKCNRRHNVSLKPFSTIKI